MEYGISPGLAEAFRRSTAGPEAPPEYLISLCKKFEDVDFLCERGYRVPLNIALLCCGELNEVLALSEIPDARYHVPFDVALGWATTLNQVLALRDDGYPVTYEHARPYIKNDMDERMVRNAFACLSSTCVWHGESSPKRQRRR